MAPGVIIFVSEIASDFQRVAWSQPDVRQIFEPFFGAALASIFPWAQLAELRT
jgi:hypothetical protein